MNLIWNNISVFIPGLGTKRNPHLASLSPIERAAAVKLVAYIRGERKQKNKQSEVRSLWLGKSILSNKQSKKSLSFCIFFENEKPKTKNKRLRKDIIVSTQSAATICQSDAPRTAPLFPLTQHFLLIFR